MSVCVAVPHGYIAGSRPALTQQICRRNRPKIGSPLKTLNQPKWMFLSGNFVAVDTHSSVHKVLSEVGATMIYKPTSSAGERNIKKERWLRTGVRSFVRARFLDNNIGYVKPVAVFSEGAFPVAAKVFRFHLVCCWQPSFPLSEKSSAGHRSTTPVRIQSTLFRVVRDELDNSKKMG